MPFAYAGHCYATTGEALEAFQKTFPVIGDVQWTGHVASSIDASGALSYTVETRAMTGNGLSSRTGTLYLVGCAEADFAPFDPVAAASMWTVMFSITLTLWVTAKKSGMILAFFKKH